VVDTFQSIAMAIVAVPPGARTERRALSSSRARRQSSGERQSGFRCEPEAWGLRRRLQNREVDQDAPKSVTKSSGTASQGSKKK
jgi:hypothetical protein